MSHEPEWHEQQEQWLHRVLCCRSGHLCLLLASQADRQSAAALSSQQLFFGASSASEGFPSRAEGSSLSEPAVLLPRRVA